jgi:N-acyl-phosphatidylethanolamine-hydrolysing phospholipase D
MKRANEMAQLPTHHQGKGFRNPWPRSKPRGLAGVVKWMLTRSRNAQPSVDSDAAIPKIKRPSRPPERSRQLTVTWIGHSSFLIQCDGLNVLTDPIWSARASPLGFAGPRRLVPAAVALRDLPPIDFTLISHDHYDHLDDFTIRALATRFPRMKWFAPLGVARFLRQRGATFVSEMDWWESHEAAGTVIGCTPAQHFSGRYPWNRDSTLWCGWAVSFPGTRVFFAGDTALHPEFAEVAKRFGPFDMAILPIGAYEPRWFMRTVHMTPEDSVTAFRDLTASDPTDRCVMVASHWGTFRLTDEPVMEPVRLARESWSVAGIAPHRLWILSHGETMKAGP